MISGTDFHISTDTALCRAGLLNCIQPIAPSFFAIIRSVLVFIGYSCEDYRNARDLDDLSSAKLGDRPVVIAVFLQYFLGMLALLRCRMRNLARCATELDGLIDDLDLTKRSMMHRGGHAEMPDLRVRKNFIHS